MNLNSFDLRERVADYRQKQLRRKSKAQEIEQLSQAQRS
jgi:hypothetical protein